MVRVHPTPPLLVSGEFGFDEVDPRCAMIRHVTEPHLRDMLAFFSKYVGSSPYGNR